MKTNRIILLSVLALMATASPSSAQAPLAETLPATAMLNDVATFNGTVNPNGTEATFWFEWGSIHDENYGNHTAPQSIGSGTTNVPVSATLSNLVQGATYHFRLVTTNSFGMAQGEEQRFWTPRIDFHAPSQMVVERGTFIDQTTAQAFPTAMAAGGNHSLALRADGTVAAWGDNAANQVSVPGNATNVTAVASGFAHGLALRSDGTVVAWGGQTNVPFQATHVTAIAAGGSQSLALLDNGTVVAWGSTNSASAEATNIAAIATGWDHNLALRNDGQIVAWGNNDHNQATIPATATNVVAVAAGGQHSLALRADGTVVAWGNNYYGQTNVPPNATNMVAIAAGYAHSMALHADGSVVVWGDNAHQQTLVPSDVNIVAIARGSWHNLALRNDGTIIGWGYKLHNQTTVPNSAFIPDLPLSIEGQIDPNALGTYTLNYSITNALGAIATASRTVTVVHVATEPATAMLNDTATFNGTVNPNGTETTAWFEWGSIHDEDYGNLTAPQSIGNGITNVSLSVVLNGFAPGFLYHYRLAISNNYREAHGEEQRFWTPVIDFHAPAFLTVEPDIFIDQTTVQAFPAAIAAGDAHSLVLRGDGTVIAWGSNNDVQTNVPPSATNVVAIAAGRSHSLALRADGTVDAWGWNTEGQTDVPAHATNVVAIAGGGSHSMALRADGSAVAWGANYSGQTDVPPSATNVVAIAAGDSHNLALRTDGTVDAWGRNTENQADVSANATNVAAIAGGNYHSMALRTDGTIIAWGLNTEGQTDVPAHATNVVAIAAGIEFNLALRADGSIVAWGANDYGQCNAPAHATNVVAIAAGYHSLALRADGTVIGWGRGAEGDGDFGQIIVSDSVYALDIPFAAEGMVQTNVLGTYVLNYSVTNALGAVATATRTVEIATLPIVTTEPAIEVGADHATLQGTANPRGGNTLAGFEYDLGASYGQETAQIPLGHSTNAEPFSVSISNLLPYLTYHYRTVASNGLGRVVGPDRIFTASAPAVDAPALSAMSDLVLAQGSVTSVWFAAEPAGVNVRVECNNPVLLSEGGLALGGSGTSRSLGIAPDPDHSGSAQITMTTSDGMQSDSQTFTVTVTPIDPSQLLNLESKTLSGGTWHLQMHDNGTASTNYMVEYRTDLSPTSSWIEAVNLVDLGSGEYEVDVGAAQGDTGFYRITGFRLLKAGLDSGDVKTEEGTGAAGAVVVFNSTYTGTLDYTWTDEQGASWTHQVQVNGTTAVIPVPSEFLGDNDALDPLEHLTLELEAGTGYMRTGDTESRVTIEENDADWQGVIETPGGTLGFTLTVLQNSGTFNGRIQSEGFGFFPTNALVHLVFAEDSFTAVATDIPLPVFATEPTLGFTNYLSLGLEAANSPGETNVSPDRIEGEASLVVKVSGEPHLDAAETGPFIMQRQPTAPSTNEVPLYPVSEGE